MPNRLITNEGTVLEDFESIVGWTIIGAGAVETLDIEHHRTGTAGVKVSSGVGVVSEIQKSNLNHDFSATKNIRMSIYVHDPTKTQSLSLYMGNEPAAFTNYFYCTLAIVFKQGWNELSIAKSKFLVAAGAPSWALPIRRIKLRNTPPAGKISEITWDSLRAGYDSTPVVIVTFDDEFISQYTKAYPIMSANGQKGIIYVMSDHVGDAGYCSVAQLREMYNAGWDMGNHTAHHLDLTTQTEAKIISEIVDCRDYLLSLGFSGVDQFAYPYAAYNASVVSIVRSLVRTARTLLNPAYSQAFVENADDMPWVFKCKLVLAATPVATLTDMIDQVIEECGVISFLFHTIVDAAPGVEDYLTADFQTFSNHLKAKSDLGLLSVMTMNQYESYFADRSGGVIPAPAISYAVPREEKPRVKKYGLV